MTWKRTKFRAVVLRLQRSSLIKPPLRRWMLNAIGAQIAQSAVIRHHCWLDSADIIMGSNTMMNAFCHYDGGEELILCRGARVAAGVRFITSSHEISDDPERRSHPTRSIRGRIVVGTGSWIGAGSTVLPGVTIAPGCVIAAASTVIGNTRPDGVYVNAADGNGAVYARRVRDLPNRPMGL